MQVVTLRSIPSITRARLGALVAIASTAVLSNVAMAQAVADPFDTALTEATTKVGTYAAALVGLAAVSVVFMIALKYVKKLPRAS